MTKALPLVSIIVPVYNAERFLADTINSVQAQTYGNWELLLINDCSTDSSEQLIKDYKENDKRIKLIRMKRNSGAAPSRNMGIQNAEGRFIAFLDADDFWVVSKLERQIKFMLDSQRPVTFTSYEFADRNGLPTGKKVIVPSVISYLDALKRSSIFTATVVVDTDKVSKDDLMMPNYQTGEDLATWWHLLKKYGDAYSLVNVLSYYRRGSGHTLSANKINAIKRRWMLYRQHEKLNLFVSIIYFSHYVIYALERRL